MNYLFKIKVLIKEKRFFKTLKKKIYPYLIGFFLFFSAKKSDFKLHITKNRNIDKDDLPLAERIFKSYKKMKLDEEKISVYFKPSSLWQTQLETSYSFLLDSHKNDDLEKFLYFLQNFGNWDTYLGVENQLFFKKYSNNFLLRNFLLKEIFKGQFDLWKLFNKNQDLGEVGMPNYGNQIGAIIKNNFITMGSFYLHMYAENILNYLDKNHNRILELGGGYGHLAYYVLKKVKNFTYIDFDLPETLTLASYFLSKSFPKKRNFFYGESKFNKTIENDFELIFLPPWEIENLDSNSIDLAINKNSLGEMDPEAAKNYLSHITRTSKYFFSVNHEHVRNSFSDGKKSLLNSEYNLDKKFKTLIKYPELGHLIWENNKLDYDGSDILFYIYEKK